jgi:hypothetical protein
MNALELEVVADAQTNIVTVAALVTQEAVVPEYKEGCRGLQQLVR